MLCAGMLMGSTVQAASYKNEAKLVDRLEKKNKNIVVSPLSLNMALAMAGNGASGSTKKEIEKYLGTDISGYNKFVKKNYSKSVKELKAANSVWSTNAPGYTLRRSYTKKLKNYYNAQSYQVDFAKRATVRKMNKWVKKHTGDMIPEIVQKVPVKTKLILVNALYFDANWMDTFYDGATADDRFTNSDNSQSDVPFMHGGAEYYFENEKATGFAKSYLNSRFEFVAVLPKEKGTFDVSGLDLSSFLASRTSDYGVTVEMPKFEFDYSADRLKKVLKASGIKKSFGSQAEFGKMFASGEKMMIDDVIQKAKIIVDEDGTKAAAATAIMAKSTAFLRRDYKTVKLDRPFVFLIYDKAADSILFIGKVNRL